MTCADQAATSAAELFGQLTEAAQLEIIDLIKSLLSVQ